MTDLQRFLKEATSEIVALGKKHGCNFTEAEVTALADGQLAEEQLDGVSAGQVSQAVARQTFDDSLNAKFVPDRDS